MPEDYEKLGLPRPLAVSQEAVDKEQRFRKIVSNDLENIPMGLIVLWAAAGSAYNTGTQTTVLVCAVLFTAARFAFTYSYMHALQPWRTLAWALGTGSIIVGGCVGTVSAWMGQKL